MPIDYKRYPGHWHEFSRYIRFERAKNRCEKCGRKNYLVYRINKSSGEIEITKQGFEFSKNESQSFQEAKELAHYWNSWTFDGLEDFTICVLTVAHLDNFGDICDCEQRTGQKCADEAHVLAMCQRCHLTYDIERHKFNARRTRAERMNQQWLGDWDKRF